jgi:hypothetical protein
MGDKRQDLIPGFVAWIDVSGNFLLEGLVEAFSEAICLRMVRGCKHLLDTELSCHSIEDIPMELAALIR